MNRRTAVGALLLCFLFSGMTRAAALLDVPKAIELLGKGRPVPLGLTTDLIEHPLAQSAQTAAALSPAENLIFAFRLIHEKYQKGKVGEYAALENFRSFSLDPRFPLVWSTPHPPNEDSWVLVGAFDLSKPGELIYPSNTRGPDAIKMNDYYPARHLPLKMSTRLDDIMYLSEVDAPLGHDGVLAAVPYARYRETLMRHMGFDPKLDPWSLPVKFKDFFRMKASAMDLRAFVKDLLDPPPSR